jgi:hypothetical protein
MSWDELVGGILLTVMSDIIIPRSEMGVKEVLPFRVANV